MSLKNSIANMRPDWVSQWDYEANGALTPENTTIMSHRKISWICSRGHKWISDPQHRSRSQDCPYCTGKKVIPKENDFGTLFPEILKEWDYSRNGSLDPYSLHFSSNKKVWWICEKKHQWKTSIGHRTHPTKGTRCPYCSNQKVVAGENDLASQRPDIAEEWDWDANAPLQPSQVTVGSGKCVQWVCKNNHRWKTTIVHRTAPMGATHCPYCDGRRAIPGKTDLATLYPELMLEWDYDSNKELDPTTLRPNSTQRAHWICKRKHRWTAVIQSRTRINRTTCPYCSGRQAIPGETDLLTKYPGIAAEWDYKNNGELHPSTTCAISNKSVAWVCKANHHWIATVASRTCNKNNCPICSGRKPDIGKNDLLTQRPEIAADWNTDGNNGLRPEEFLVNSSYIADWRCHLCGTTWKKTITARTHGNTCPMCHGIGPK